MRSSNVRLQRPAARHPGSGEVHVRSSRPRWSAVRLFAAAAAGLCASLGAQPAAAVPTPTPTPTQVPTTTALAPTMTVLATPVPRLTPTPSATVAPTSVATIPVVTPATSTPSPLPSATPPPTPTIARVPTWTPPPTSASTPTLPATAPPIPTLAIRTPLPRSPTVPPSPPAGAGGPNTIVAIQMAVPPTGGTAVSGNLSLSVPAYASGPAGVTLVVTPLAPATFPMPPPGMQPGDGKFIVTLMDRATGQPMALASAPLTLVYRASAAEIARANGDISRVRLAVWTGSAWAANPCISGGQLLACSVPRPSVFQVVIAPPAAAPLDTSLPNGHFFKEANGFGGAGDLGFTVSDDAEARFWSEFQRLGAAQRVGWPISNRFSHQGFVTQAFERLALQWRPELGQAVPVNIFQEFTGVQDLWLEQAHQVPAEPDANADQGLSWPVASARHRALLDPYPQLRQFYTSDPNALETYGLPLSARDFGGTVVVRLQRAVLVQRPGEAVGMLLGGALSEEVGLWPPDALVPQPLR
jgi:hypothetical protein